MLRWFPVGLSVIFSKRYIETIVLYIEKDRIGKVFFFRHQQQLIAFFLLFSYSSFHFRFCNGQYVFILLVKQPTPLFLSAFCLVAKCDKLYVCPDNVMIVCLLLEFVTFCLLLILILMNFDDPELNISRFIALKYLNHSYNCVDVCYLS